MRLSSESRYVEGGAVRRSQMMNPEVQTRSRVRRRRWVVAGMAGLIGLVVALLVCERESVVNGRTVTEWAFIRTGVKTIPAGGADKVHTNVALQQAGKAGGTGSLCSGRAENHGFPGVCSPPKRNGGPVWWGYSYLEPTRCRRFPRLPHSIPSYIQWNSILMDRLSLGWRVKNRQYRTELYLGGAY